MQITLTDEQYEQVMGLLKERKEQAAQAAQQAQAVADAAKDIMDAMTTSAEPTSSPDILKG